MAGFWPAAYATELALASSDPAAQSSQRAPQSTGSRSAARARYALSSVSASPERDTRVRPTPGEDYRYGIGYATLADSREDDFRFRLAEPLSSHPSLKLAPTSVMLRTGWAWSGRLGPVRWLGPIDGEGGETTLSLRRVHGQPRMEGGGRLQISIHYTFE